MGTTIAISNFKGGILKTTSTANTGACLASKGYRTLLIDLDPQFNLTTFWGIDNQKTNIFKILVEGQKIDPVKLRNNLYIVPSELELVRGELSIFPMMERESKLLKALKPIKDDFDFIIIDCPPSLGLLTINAYYACDLIFVPIECEYLSYNGLKVLERALDALDIDIDKIFATKYDGRKVLHQSILETIQADDRAFKTPIRTNVASAESGTAHQSIFEYSPNSNGAKDYENLTKEIIDYVKA
jgi:chromosome partitioning protein